jgi:hypothetical protein
MDKKSIVKVFGTKELKEANMTISEIVSTLSKPRQLELAIQFLQKAIIIWDQYAAANKLDYIDTVVGMSHEVKANLLERMLEVAAKELKEPGTHAAELKALDDEYTDPIVALQDNDWELPYEVERIFYASFNLLEHLNGKEMTAFKEETIYVCINQAVDAILTKELMSQSEINAWVTQFGYRA